MKVNGPVAHGLEWGPVRPVCPPTRRVATSAAAATAIVFASAGAWAAPLDLRGEDWEGLSQFVHLAELEIGSDRVIVRDALDLEELKANDAIVLIHPQRDVAAEELSVFMRAGGRVVLLDDFGAGDKLLAHFRIRRVPLPAHPAEMLRHNPAFAIAEPASEHAAVRDVERVVTNRATGFADTGLAPLLVVHGRSEPDVLLAVAGVVGNGRFLAVGDGSIAMNAMLRFPGNHALARAVVRYATEATPADAKGETADGKLYLLANDGTLTGRFGSGPTGPLGDARRAFFEALELLRRGMPPLVVYLAALFVGAGVVLWASRRAGRTHKPSVPRFVRPVPVTDQGGVAGHAAILASSGASLVSAASELRSAVEEQIASRLGLEEPAPHDALVAKVRSAGLLGQADAAALARLLADLSRFDPLSAGKEASRRRIGRFGLGDRRGDLVALTHRARELLGAMDFARHGTIARPT